ncbi:putative pachytene checkpoint protein 2 [Aphelenchoides besseyi]|nr:putative pachytene checkpoint protein 2 [Aphelenchoides besseyi]KAI6194215.1 putative pachytene checkpoint protein 2 [Aphelenchoides besseyi]
MGSYPDMNTLRIEDLKSELVVEARLNSKADGHEYKADLIKLVESVGFIPNWSSIPVKCPKLSTVVDHLLVGSHSTNANEKVRAHAGTEVLFYSARESEALAQEINLDDNRDESTVASLQWELPNLKFDHLFENLFYEDNIKTELLAFVSSVVNLSRMGVDTNVIDLNRLILLHGPPGTGKTTLCKGVAQRLAVRLQNTYKRTIFCEINSHSLFSKWFSESGKLVQKLFEQIADLASDPDWLVIVLVDEVESLVMGRNASTSEPTDAVRAVNAVLTQIDQIRTFPNVFVMTTSNITGALDSAFLDRTDLARYVGNPTAAATIKILQRAIVEFSRLGIIIDGMESDVEQKLQDILPANIQVSGRLLKKIPVLTYAQLNKSTVTLDEFVSTLRELIVGMKNP